MIDWVERYVHQVGRYVPPKERAEIEAELRSQIRDQLEGRYGATATEEEIMTLLAEWGAPYQLAASYHHEQYLVGPDLYPMLVAALRRGWLIVPPIAAFLSVFSALADSPQPSWERLLLSALFAALQAAVWVFSVVVLFFSILQRSMKGAEQEWASFNPRDLPPVDAPHLVDRSEAIIGSAIGIVIVLALLLFWANGAVLFPQTSYPVFIARPWLIALIATISGIIAINITVARRNRWSSPLWLLETFLEVFGTICLYFVLYRPLADYLLATHETFGHWPFIAHLPQFLVVISVLVKLASAGSKQARLWGYNPNADTP